MRRPLGPQRQGPYGRRADGARAAVLLFVVAVMAAALVVDWPVGVLHGRVAHAPSRLDYMPIDAVPARPPAWAAAVGSGGRFTSSCGLNERNHHNSDNLITFPGQPGAAQHVHEYVGNISTEADATDVELAAAETSCTNGDQSAYFWVVLRDITHRTKDAAAKADPWYGGLHNDGTRIAATSVLIEYRGNPTSDVVAMPRFLRLIAGNARSLTLPATGSSQAQWSCSGSPGQVTLLYPLCPAGQRVVRTFDFPSCWDGLRRDSPTHRAHALYPGSDGSCPHGTFPIPQLRLQVIHDVPSGRSYAIDTFPDQRRSPVTDHAEFINLMPDQLMARAVECINAGRTC